MYPEIIDKNQALEDDATFRLCFFGDKKLQIKVQNIHSAQIKATVL